MKRIKKLCVISITLISVFLCCCFFQSNVYAFWKESKDSDGTVEQCFSIQYKYVSEAKPTDNKFALSSGQPTRKDVRVYSTNRVCAEVKDGKVIDTVNIVAKPSGTAGFSNGVLGNDGPQLDVCEENGTYGGSTLALLPVGKRCSDGEFIKTWNVKGKNFKTIAQEATSAAPSTIRAWTDPVKKENAKRMALEDNNNTREEQIKTDEEMGIQYPDSDGTALQNCKSGGAKALGWIVCPIIEWSGDAAQTVYNDYIEPALNIDARLFDESENGGAMQQAWGTFRDIANIIFVILLLAVIISQLTGVGIDNYGIKKILPKLIVVAVLVNLSYFLCVLAVDISNILGNSFQALFDGLGQSLDATTLNISDAKFSGDSAEIKSTAGSIAGLGVLGALAGMTGAIWATPAVIMSLLVGAIGVVVAIFFLFILLSAREAAIVVLITIAPVAIVLYALPNTKKIFDKWLNLFKGLLLVYPIAGLLVGGGDYVSALLLAVGGGDSFFNALTAMVVGVLPIFFIPTVLRSAFAAMGNLGAKISGFGQRVGAGATRAVRDSSTYQGLQDRAGKFAVKQRAEMGKKYALGDGRYARFRRGMLGGTRGIAADIAMSKKAEADEVGNYMTFINDRTRNGEDEDELKRIYEGFMGSENKAGAVAAARIAGRRKDTAANFAKHYTDNKENYNPEIARSIAKEIATGENSANYRAAAPLAFEYASQVNSGKTNDNYGEWTNNKQNIADALEHHVTNTQELVGMKGSSLKEINDLIAQDKVDDATKARLQNLALQTIENRKEANAPWDTTKAGQVAILSGQYKYDSGTDTLSKI